MNNLISFSSVLFFAVANTGSLGSGSTITDGNKTVRRKLLNRVRSTTKKVGSIAALLIQESGFNDFLAAPIFNGPVASNFETNYQTFNPRGVCTFADSPEVFFDPRSDSEIVTTIHTYNYKNKRKRVRQCNLGVLNIYRNHGDDLNDLITHISEVMDLMKQERNINKFLCAGDFNADNFSIPGLNEISHPLLSHRHNSHSAPKFIDKVFSNVKEVDIVAVEDSVENKADSLGHKFYVIKVGTDLELPTDRIPSTNIIKPSRLRKAAKMISDPRLSEEHIMTGAINDRAADLQDIFSSIISNATVEVTEKKDGQKLVTLDDIEAKIDTSGKDVQKHFYDFVDLFRKKKCVDTSTTRPELQDFVNVLEKKLKGLNTPDYSLVSAVIEEAHNEVNAKNYWNNKSRHNQNSGHNVPKPGMAQPVSGRASQISAPTSGPQFPSFNSFKKLVNSLSNSNAKDVNELSTKNLKTILNYNQDISRALWYLCRRIFSEGSLPACLKEDKIGFLYKRKGSRTVAKNYRPITIASTLGKVVEKILANELDKINDANPWNHAYKKARSTQSAVINAIETVSFCKLEVKRLRKLGFNASIVLMAEDISSAFESVDGKVICDYLAPFDTNPDFQMMNITKSYLNRKSTIIEKGLSGIVNKPSKSRSTPQGSILSCRYWRIFDGLATRVFMNGVTVFTKASYHVEMVHHLSYADDHLSIIVIKWTNDVDNPPKEITHSLLCIRRIFDDATKAVGCGMNIDKSEIITDIRLWGLRCDKDFKNSFIWLGYSLSIKNDELIFNSDKFSSKKNEIRQYVKQIFQYAPSISIRRKIYITYISPIIDYYLPTIIMVNQNKINELEAFQSEILKKVLGVPNSCPSNLVERVLRIDSVSKRLNKACLRFRTFLISDLDSSPEIGVRTRSNNQVKFVSKDISARIRWLASKYSNCTKKNKFDAKYAEKWAIITNKRFSKFLTARTCN